MRIPIKGPEKFLTTFDRFTINTIPVVPCPRDSRNGPNSRENMELSEKVKT
jgi:hypothetical protein